MLVSHRKKFIYTKTNKTAGTSVECYFEKYCMPEGQWEFSHDRDEYVSETGIIGSRLTGKKNKQWYNHMPAADIRRAIGESIWQSYFKFCVIRNPFDKLISIFYFRNRNTDWNVEDPVKLFRRWMRSVKEVKDRDRYMIDNRICVDYFIRYEELENGIRHVCDTLAIPFVPDEIPRLKSGIRKQHFEIENYYDDRTAGIVNKLYAFELETFNYSLPG